MPAIFLRISVGDPVNSAIGWVGTTVGSEIQKKSVGLAPPSVQKCTKNRLVGYHRRFRNAKNRLVGYHRRFRNPKKNRLVWHHRRFRNAKNRLVGYHRRFRNPKKNRLVGYHRRYRNPENIGWFGPPSVQKCKKSVGWVPTSVQKYKKKFVGLAPP